ncbi:hypothetical protein Tco_0780762 [Tanacetum coccineum]
MASAGNSSCLALQRKERCTSQCALSLEEEKSSCLRPFSSTIFMLFHAHFVIKNGQTAPAHISLGPGPQLLTPGTISSGLVPQPPSQTPNVPPIKNDWDTLFCPMFDEYFNPSPSVVQPVLVAAVQEHVVSTGTPSSTRIDKIYLLQVSHKPLKKHNLMLFLLVLKKMIMVKLDELGGVLKNKANQGAKGKWSG